MIVTSSFQELKDAKGSINDLQKNYPVQYQQLINAIKLTRQLQYGLQYFGCFLLDEDCQDFTPPEPEESYVLSIYQDEINKLKQDPSFSVVKQLLKKHQAISYENVCRLAIGSSPEFLVGPLVVK